MNKVYRKIWSRALKQFVVVSELAACRRSGGSGSGATRRSTARRVGTGSVGALMALGYLGWTGPAHAQAVCSAPPYNVAVGTALCLGVSATADGGGDGQTALGTSAHAGAGGALAVGYNSFGSSLNSIALGFQAFANNTNSIYLGARTGPATGALGESSIGIGTDVTASGSASIGIGVQTIANQAGSIAFGTSSHSTGAGSVALGVGTSASGSSAVSIGTNSASAGISAIAMGSFASADVDSANSVVLGSSSKAVGAQNAVALGTSAAANTGQATALGAFTIATGEGALAAGLSSQSLFSHATAVGWQAYATELNAIYLGARTTGTGASAESAIAIGTDVSSSGQYSIAMGLQASASQADAIAIGRQAKATGQNSMYLGALPSGIVGSGATANNAIAVGIDVTASGVGSVAVGNFTVASGLNSLALGSSIASATNAAAVGRGNSASAGNSLAVGFSSQAQAASTIAIGDTNTVAAAAGTGSMAGGHNSQVTGGIGAIALGEGQIANGNGAVAIGDPNGANGNGAIAMGSNNTANGDGAVAQGNGNNAQGIGSVAVGNASSALGAGSLAFGNTATANNANDVALGSGSTTAAVVRTAGTTINGTPYSFAGATPNSTVSVGATNAERTITHVAAGRIDGGSTDAINGSQLFATNQAVTAVGTTVTNLGNTIAGGIGGGTTYDPATGNVTTSVTYGGTTYNSLQDVFNQIGGAVGGSGIKYFHANSTLADSQANGVNSVAIGPVSNATTTNAVSIGNGATAGTNVGDVALGAGSATGAVVPTTGTTINGNNYAYAGTTPTSTVSVGAAGAERTVTNVAAGRVSGASTDAINGSQLFATNQAVGTVGSTVTNLGNTIATSIGGSTTYNPATGAINTSITYGGNTYSSLQQIFNQIGGGGGIKYFHANSNLADSLANGLNSVAIGPVSTANTENAVSIGNGATAGSNVGDAALGAGSTTGTVVATAGGSIAGNNYTYAGTAPTSTVSVGAAGAERTITNVAAGQVNGASTDAINGSQLFATNQALETLNNTMEAGATHYYSVNDGGTTGGNFANNGATGLNALAAGVGATAAANNATAVGQGTGVSVLGGVALGSAALSDRAIAPGTGTIIDGTNVIPFNTSDRTLLGAVSLGNATGFRQITNLADGTENQDAVSLRQLKGALSSFAVTATKYFHAKSDATDSAAIGQESVAIGPQTTVNGDNGIGMGNQAIVAQTAPGGTAIGQNSTVNLSDGVALGTNATSNGIQAMALGAGTQAAFAGSVALGAGSVTDAAVGTSGVTLNGSSYTFAGAAPGSTVSVGSIGAVRTITNLGAGRISATSTDAINGSQLYATNQTLELLGSQIIDLSNTVNNFPTGGGGGDTNNTYNNSTEDNTASSATGNESTAAGAGSSASGDHSTSVGAGSSANGDNSVAIGAGSVANGSNTVSVGSAGHERTITNVANGVNPTDAANVGQVNQALEEAKNWSKDYVDQRLQGVNRDLDRVGDRANAGIASAMAMAGLGQAYQPNQSSAGVALGSFHGETGIAVGVSTITESGRYILKLNGTTNSRGDAGASIGATVVW